MGQLVDEGHVVLERKRRSGAAGLEGEHSLRLCAAPRDCLLLRVQLHLFFYLRVRRAPKRAEDALLDQLLELLLLLLSRAPRNGVLGPLGVLLLILGFVRLSSLLVSILRL